MKILKVLSTSAIAAALLASTGMTAFAVEAPDLDEPVDTIVLGEGDDSDTDVDDLDDDDSDTDVDDLDDDDSDTDLGDDGDEISDEDWAKFAEAMETLASLMDNSILVDENGKEVDDEVKAKLLVADTEEEAAAALGDGSYIFYIDGTDFMYFIHVENGEVETVVLTEEELKEALKESENSGEFTDDDDDDWFGFGKKDKKENDAEYTLIDVVEAAKNAGVNSINVQTLRNFLILNDEYFDSDDYADFIDAVNEIRDLYITDLAYALFYKTPDQLTESERYDVYDALSHADKVAIQKDFIDLANDHGVLLTWDWDANGYPVVYGSIRGKYDQATTKASSGASNVQVAGGSAVANTGDVAQEGNSSAAAFAGVALALAAAGVVIVARKNRA
jgi:hypothetical protein